MFVRLAEGHRLKQTLSGLALAGALALALGAMGPVALAAPKTNADPGSISLDIVQPAGNNNIAEGPVGANISVQGNATAGDSINLGVASRGDGCATGFQQLNGVTATAQADGSFTATFQWPQIANNVGERYFVCAQDTTNSAIGASQTLFQVDSSDAPSITVTQVSDPTAPTPGAGTPTPQPPSPPDGSIYAGGFIEVKGQNFTPGGTPIQIVLTPSQLTLGTALSPLPLVSGEARTTHNGSFDIIVQAPSGQTGQFYISATSTDGTGSTLPTLVGSESVQVVLQPTPTPGPTPTATPKASPTTDTGGTNVKNSSGPGPARIIGAIALGLFSAIFFIIGVAMLISASGMGNAPTRSQLR